MRKTSLLLMAIVAALGAALGSCNDNSTIGSSLVQNPIEVVIDSSFTVSGHSAPMASVQSRTISQLLGVFSAPGYGRMESNVVTQFMPASRLCSSEVTVDDIDSLVLYMYVFDGEYVGDTLAPMGLEVYRLEETLPSPIFSDFDPTGYYNPDKPLASVIYNVSHRDAKLIGDTVAEGLMEIKAKLPVELGRELYGAYLENPKNFLSPTAFNDNVFKGLYLKNSFGSGRLVRSSTTEMVMYYHHYYADQDTTIKGYGQYFAVSPEVVTNNDVTVQISDALQARADQGEAIVVGPVGMEVKMRFPAPEMLAKFNSDPNSLKVLNALSFTVPARPIENEYGFGLPTYLLMVLEKERESFFANNKLPDNKTSFYAKYNSETSKYDFGDMAAYLSNLAVRQAAGEEIVEEDYSFVIVPVLATFETSSNYYYGTTEELTMMTPYMAAPVMGRLLLDQTKIKFTYTLQQISK